MRIEEIKSVGILYTWANNREGKGYVEEKLDRFFGAASWISRNLRAKVIHVEK